MRSILNNRKAQGHVEVIISFALFMGFMMFLFIIFRPFEKPVNPEIVDGVYEKLSENLRKELEIASIKRTDGGTGDFLINEGDVEGLDLCGGGNDMVVKEVNVGNGLYDVYCGDGLDSSGGGVLTSDKYDVIYVNPKQLWSESAIKDLKNVYCDDYNSVKEDGYVLPSNDFAVVVRSENLVQEDWSMRNPGTVNCDSAPPISTTLDVFSKFYAIETFDKDANIKQFNLQVIAW